MDKLDLTIRGARDIDAAGRNVLPGGISRYRSVL